MIKCLHCGAECSNGLALCELCQRLATECFEFLPTYFRNLARWKPGRAGSRPVPGSRVLYDGHVPNAGTGDKISDTLDEVMTMLTTFARQLTDDRPDFPRPLTFADAVLRSDLSDEVVDQLTDDPARTASLLCAGFTDRLTSISTIDWCGEFVRQISEAEERLRKLTETYVPGWYAGACRQLAGVTDDGNVYRCGSGTYVVPGLTWVTCGTCGTTTYARDHLEVVLNEARDWVARPKALAAAVVALVDTEQSVPRLYDRIRKWASDGDLTTFRHTSRGYKWDDDNLCMVVVDEPTGPARYRLGDVVDLALRNTRSLNRRQAS